MQRQKNIQVCGIGNGVVDVQYQISDEFLNELDVPKGEMRLVNAEYHKELQEKLKNIKPNRCGGGSAGNTIDAFAKFGGKAAMLTQDGLLLKGDWKNENFSQYRYTKIKRFIYIIK